MKRGNNLEWVQNSTYQEGSLKWYADCTASTSDINIIYRAPALQELLNNG